MKDIENFKEQLDAVALEERLELINLANTQVETSSNTVCCCSDLAE